MTTRGSAAYDPAELVRAAAGLLADDPSLLAAERDRLAFIYVDELADTDPAQIELLTLVAGGGRPLVAFADPDSSIFAFRGADPAAVTNFPMKFRTASGALAETITLHTNYRATSQLLGATSRVARRMRGPITHRPMHPPADPARAESGAGPAVGGAGPVGGGAGASGSSAGTAGSDAGPAGSGAASAGVPGSWADWERCWAGRGGAEQAGPAVSGAGPVGGGAGAPGSSAGTAGGDAGRPGAAPRRPGAGPSRLGRPEWGWARLGWRRVGWHWRWAGRERR